MKLKTNFAFRPIPPITTRQEFSKIHGSKALGPLEDLLGTWTGKGFNVIWKPLYDGKQPKQHRSFELNLFEETLQFERATGQIPNRGLLQHDIYMYGITYLQQVTDPNNNNKGLHIETGMWMNVPKTKDPTEPPSVVRMAAIPHGTTILAQGEPSYCKGPPTIPGADITPFVIEHPKMRIPFPEADLSKPSKYREPVDPLKLGISQDMVDNPNSVLVSALVGKKITDTVALTISSNAAGFIGGGVANTAFLQGNAIDGPNAQAALVDAIFWIEKIRGGGLLLQYTQTVLLNFRGLSWPHISVATLRKRR